jgi:hypothetical protein
LFSVLVAGVLRWVSGAKAEEAKPESATREQRVWSVLSLPVDQHHHFSISSPGIIGAMLPSVK